MKPLASASLGQVALGMRDVAAARAFYETTLGLPLLFEAGGMCFFRVGSLRLMLGPCPPGQAGGNSILYFTVTDLPAVHEALAAAGVRILRTPHIVAPLGARDLWLCEFADPEGNALAAMEERPAAAR